MSKKIDPKVAEEVMLKAGFKPLEPYDNSHVSWKSKHLVCGQIVKPSLGKIKSGRKGCSFCQNRIDPILAINIMMKAKIKPLTKYSGADTPWKSICLVCKNLISPNLSGVKRGKGCKYCKRKFVDPEKAIKFMISRNFKPYKPFTRASDPWRSRCLKCNQDVNPSYSSIKAGQGCVSCAGIQIRPDHAVAIMLKANLEPLEPYKNGQYKWKCQCLKCGEMVTPTYSSVQQGQGGCIYCVEKGFDPKKSSYLYIIKNKNLNSIKVGIGNMGKKNNDRTKIFSTSGWKIYKKWNFKKGIIALGVEKEVLRIVREELKIPQHLSKSKIGYGHGHTETINADSITLLELEKIVKKVIKGYRQ